MKTTTKQFDTLVAFASEREWDLASICTKAIKLYKLEVFDDISAEQMKDLMKRLEKRALQEASRTDFEQLLGSNSPRVHEVLQWAEKQILDTERQAQMRILEEILTRYRKGDWNLEMLINEQLTRLKGAKTT
jgi:flagellar hook-basal body complex protein FliE